MTHHALNDKFTNTNNYKTSNEDVDNLAPEMAQDLWFLWKKLWIVRNINITIQKLQLTIVFNSKFKQFLQMIEGWFADLNATIETPMMSKRGADKQTKHKHTQIHKIGSTNCEMGLQEVGDIWKMSKKRVILHKHLTKRKLFSESVPNSFRGPKIES